MATKKTTSATGGTKAKTTSKSKTASKPGSSAKAPTLEEIRKKAAEIYHDRISRGEHGSAEDDWLKAEQILKAGKK